MNPRYRLLYSDGGGFAVQKSVRSHLVEVGTVICTLFRSPNRYIEIHDFSEIKGKGDDKMSNRATRADRRCGEVVREARSAHSLRADGSGQGGLSPLRKKRTAMSFTVRTANGKTSIRSCTSATSNAQWNWPPGGGGLKEQGMARFTVGPMLEFYNSTGHFDDSAGVCPDAMAVSRGIECNDLAGRARG